MVQKTRLRGCVERGVCPRTPVGPRPSEKFVVKERGGSAGYPLAGVGAATRSTEGIRRRRATQIHELLARSNPGGFWTGSYPGGTFRPAQRTDVETDLPICQRASNDGNETPSLSSLLRLLYCCPFILRTPSGGQDLGGGRTNVRPRESMKPRAGRQAKKSPLGRLPGAGLSFSSSRTCAKIVSWCLDGGQGGHPRGSAARLKTRVWS